MKDIFRHQIWHLLFLLISIVFLHIFTVDSITLTGEFWDVSTKTWFWIAIAVPVIHQVYVLVIWRLELYHSTFTKRFELTKAFKMYAIGFSILFVSRLIFITILAISDKNSLSMNPIFAYSIIAVIIPLVAYIWIHYYFTERPDMKKIYEKMPE